jgi:LmbE family N-acetylglucosaminyl deacetylase
MNQSGIELDVLAVFSHPDNADLTVAGTLLKMKSLGYRTGVVDIARGAMGTRVTLEIRAEKAKEAARILGLDVRTNLELSDSRLMLNDESRLAMVRVIRKYRPKLILTLH